MGDYYKSHLFQYMVDLAQVEEWEIPLDINTEEKYKIFLTSMVSDDDIVDYVRNYALDHLEWMGNFDGCCSMFHLIAHHLWIWNDGQKVYKGVHKYIRQMRYVCSRLRGDPYYRVRPEKTIRESINESLKKLNLHSDESV